MSSLNKIILIGEVASEPDIKATTSGDSVCNFLLTVQRPARVENATPGADTVKVVAWREKAEQMKHVGAGQTILVEGRIHTRSYDNNEGQKVYVTEVEAKELRPIGEQRSSLDGFELATTIREESSAKKPRKKAVLEDKASKESSNFDFGDAEPVEPSPFAKPQFESDDIPF